MVRWLRWHCSPDTGFKTLALAVWGRARYISVTEASHKTDFHMWMGKKQLFVFFKPPRTGTEPRTLAWKAAVLTTTLGPPPPPRKGNSSDQKQCNEVARVVNEYMSSLADAQPDQYTFIDTWSKLWSSKGHAIKQYYDSNDPKGVHLSKKGKELLINKKMSTMCPTTAKRKNSSTHSPSADNTTKEQRLDSQQNVDLITFTDTQ